MHPWTSHSAELAHVEAVTLWAAGKTTFPDGKEQSKARRKGAFTGCAILPLRLWSCCIAGLQYLLVIQFTASVLYRFRFPELHLDMILVPTSF